ncbi:MerR family transcriptional regulator [Nitrosomonas eutropha]|uniref:MerR family transcriptional regulator n=2 Tax=Nitrosomonas eutropha TaxID=916 RepID=A0ABX5MA69_9PROT|nr:helix-turn-helix domain-containing protein [Nitrosomonas eutropha]ABI58373.1 transcriptional regulator, MerR family [Nitrosomonas eutropha C91]PXV84198.1 MerR family transcriptional regulator [Nitrosomonas eutropha]
MNQRTLTIGVLARATGTNIETIRYYEREGLLPKPERTKGNYRAYEASHQQRLGFIRKARDLGFSLAQVRTLLSLSDDKSRSCSAIDEIAMEHRKAVEQKILDLRALKAELDNLIDQCSCGTVAECRIIESLSPSAGLAR